MYGWCMFDIEQMNQQQIGALAGGLVLRLELNSQTSQFKRRNKSSESLIKVFWPTDARPRSLSMAVQIMANLARLT
jgi:hypothetical protein